MIMIIIIIIIKLCTIYNCLRTCFHSGLTASCLVTSLQHTTQWTAALHRTSQLRPAELLHCQQTVNPLQTTANTWTLERTYAAPHRHDARRRLIVCHAAQSPPSAWTVAHSVVWQLRVMHLLNTRSEYADSSCKRTHGKMCRNYFECGSTHMTKRVRRSGMQLETPS